MLEEAYLLERNTGQVGQFLLGQMKVKAESMHYRAGCGFFY